MTHHVSFIGTYPVKSAGGIAHQFALTNDYGFAGDRSFMVVSPRNNLFITQRSHPKLAALRVDQDQGGRFVLGETGNRFMPLRPEDLVAKGAEPELYGHFKNKFPGYDCGDDIAAFLTEFLGDPARLVWMGEGFDRKLDPNFDAHERKTGYADGYPFLIATVASLNAVRAQMEAEGLDPVGMDRFRPNIVVDGDFAPFDEDLWHSIRIGDGPVLELLKPCVRCAIPSVDQVTGDRGDPMMMRNVLKNMGRWGEIPIPDGKDGKPDKGPLFGMNAALAAGQSPVHKIEIGQSVAVLERRAQPLWVPVANKAA